MKLEKAALIAEIIGGIAIVLTLISLIVEVRKNTEVIRDQAAQEVLDRSFRGYSLTLDKENYDLWSSLVSGRIDNVDPDEQSRARFLARAVFVGNDNAFYQYRKGYVDDEVWQATSARFSSLMQNPGIRDWWREDKHLFAPSFQKYVETVISEYSSD